MFSITAQADTEEGSEGLVRVSVGDKRGEHTQTVITAVLAPAETLTIVQSLLEALVAARHLENGDPQP